MIAIRERHGKDADHRFAELPWDEHTPRWQEIDQYLPADHLARQIDQAVEELDLAVESLPGWMAKYPETRERQLERYEQAQVRMDQLQTENAHRTSSKRKKPEEVPS